MRYNTNNPAPSSDPRDFNDNSLALDEGMASLEDTFVDRFGRPRYTYQAFHNLVIDSKAQVAPTVAAAKAAVNSTADAAIEEMQETAATLGDDLNNKRYTSYSEMNADPQTRGAVVAVVDGDQDPNLNGWYSWNNNAKTWVRFLDQPIFSSVLAQTIAQDDSTSSVFSVADENDLVMLNVDAEGGIGTQSNSLTAAGIKNPIIDILSIAANEVQLVDASGFVALNLAEPAEDKVTDATAGLVERNAVNLAASSAVRGEFNSQVQRPTGKYNHILMYGQSLSTAQEGWPALSIKPYGGNLMYGASTRPSTRVSADFTPLSGANLKPLKAVVQSEDGSSILTDAQVAALATGASNEGEGPEVAMTNYARKQFLQYHGVEADPSRLFVASSCGVNGRTVEQLSSGANPNLYQRLLQAAQGVKAIADAEGATYRVPAIVWMQGEWNYVTTYGGDATKAGYKAKLLAQAQIWTLDIAQGIADQPAPPAIITYQTGAGFTRDDNDLSIGMAQWELSQEQPNWYMAAPYYPYTDKGGHLDANGYRWLGHQLGKVFHRVVTMGQDWKPLSPRNVTVSGTRVLIDFHVPCPPLMFDKPYVALAATDYASKGFRVVDSAGSIAITSVKIVADTIVELLLDRAPSTNTRVQYATQTASQGNGCLRDSDPAVAMDNYEYEAGRGQYAGANIAALINKPYPLYNWCIAFSLTPTEI